MADITIVGMIESIRYLPANGGCLMFLSEYKKGYRKSNGETVDDRYMSWKVIFKQGLVNYINGHFNNGMVVEVKGDAIPYAIDHGQVADGYSVIGQTVNIFSIPRPFVLQERKMQKESQIGSSGIPDLKGYNEPDF